MIENKKAKNQEKVLMRKRNDGKEMIVFFRKINDNHFQCTKNNISRSLLNGNAIKMNGKLDF
jgi:hypothetical protein